jgi:hypothetical protein
MEMDMATKRYAVECDSPDCGHSTYAECWGAGGQRGRVLSEHDSLADAVQACGGRPSVGPSASTPWIWDRRLGRAVQSS